MKTNFLRTSVKIRFYISILFFCALSSGVDAQMTTMNVGGRNRSLFVYAPVGIPQQRPLVISLHGLNQDINYQKNQAKWELVADTAKFVVVYPAGEGNSWDISGNKDTDFILAIIESMVTRYGIDRNRVYVSGFSMGGMMSYHVANKIANKVAAIGPVSGYLFSNPVSSSRPMPIMHVHGTADDVVNYSGVAAILQKWRNWNQCPSNGVRTNPYPSNKPNSNAYLDYWGPCNNSSVSLITLPGKGHWHSNDPNGVNTTNELWNFFRKQSLGNSNTPPMVSLTSPAANASFTAPATINIAANASDANGTVSSVAFYNGSTLLGTDATAPYNYTWTNVAAGTYSITARATDNGGATTTSTAVSVSVTGTVNTPPTVSLTSPAANASFTAPATINIAANASDANGTVSSVAFYNGSTLLGTDATAPYSYTWTNVAAGTYSITARATDNGGATTTSTAVSVTVTGVTGTDPIIGPSCGSNNSTLSLSLNSANRVNVTSYNWWYTGSAASTAAVSGAPYSVTIQTGANFSSGQVCVGTNLSVSPWYVQYCKSITKCAGARMSVDEFGVETLMSTEIQPNPSADNFSVTAAGDVSKITVFNETGREVYRYGSMEKGATISIGNELAGGVYVVTIQYLDGTTETKRIVKIK